MDIYYFIAFLYDHLLTSCLFKLLYIIIIFLISAMLLLYT